VSPIVTEKRAKLHHLKTYKLSLEWFSMELNKILKAYGNSVVVVFTKEDLIVMGKKIGDVVKVESGE